MKRLARKLLVWRPGSAATRLILRTASREWPLLALQAISALVLALGEGSTFLVLFQAVRLLTGPEINGTSALGPWLTALSGRADLTRAQVFLLLLAFALGLQLLVSVARYVNSVAVATFASHCQLRIAPTVHRWVLGLSYACASSYRVGDLVHRASFSPTAVQVQLQQMGDILVNLLLIAVYLGVLLRLAPLLSLVALLMGLGIALLQQVLRPAIRRASHQLALVRQEIAGGITEDIQLLRLLHSTGSIDGAMTRLEERLGRLAHRMRRLNRLIPVMEPVIDLLPVVAAVVLAVAAWQLYGGEASQLLPNLITFVLAIQRLNLRLGRLSGAFSRLDENSGPMQQLEELLDPTDKQFRRHGGIPFAGLHHAIRFEGVTLRYWDRPRAALQSIDFEIHAGHTLALVGESGAGKSSIVDLLMGLQTPSQGCITVDGVDLRSLDLNQWQRRLGVVSQDVLLINGTIRDNIAFCLPEATQEQIAAAAEAAAAAGFIEALPAGYDTVVGERGFRLSGGQRQRLSLARALLRDPDLLILDEATSALDSPTEARILEALDRFTENRSVLTVAHRLSSVIHADQILVLAQGRIVERGRHDELLSLQGTYAALWRQQASPSCP